MLNNVGIAGVSGFFRRGESANVNFFALNLYSGHPFLAATAPLNATKAGRRPSWFREWNIVGIVIGYLVQHGKVAVMYLGHLLPLEKI